MSTILMAPPRQGWMRGQYDSSRLDLNFDRTAATVRGEVERNPVSLQTDHDRATITGEANRRPVDLTFQWSPTHVHYAGQANGTDLSLDVDYTSHTVSGHNGASDINLRFDDTSAQGEAGGKVNLQLTSDGHLTGLMCGHSLDAQTANVDMGQMLSHIFLFAPGT